MAPKFLIACDPGIRECGIAVFDLELNRLLAAWLVQNPEKSRRGNGAWSELALEVQLQVKQRFPEATFDGEWAYFLGETPVVHKDKRTDREERINPNQLFQTSGASGAVGAALLALSAPRYQEEVESDLWTGGVGKEERQRGWWQKHPEEVRKAITAPAPSYLNHVIDAVDMGFWFRRWWKLWVTSGCVGKMLPQRARKRAGAKRASGMRQAKLPGLPGLKSASLPAPGAPRKTYGQQLRERGLLPPAPAKRAPRRGARGGAR